MTSRYLLPFIHQCHVTVRTLSVSLCNRPATPFYLKICGQDTLKLCPWKWLYDREFALHNMNEWTLSSGFAYVAYIDVPTPPPRIPMIWRHDKEVRQRTSHAKSRHSFITTVWGYNILYQTSCLLSPQYGDTTYCIIHLVFYHHSVEIQHIVSDILYPTDYFR